jgi:SAM-dependent methyltransferase
MPLSAPSSLSRPPTRGIEHLRTALQARTWERATRALLDDLDLPQDARILDAGRLTVDDVFHAALPPARFDVVHARFQLCTLGRAAEQLEVYRRLVAPGGILILEEPDTRSWLYEPYAPATQHLIGRVAQALTAGGGNLDAGRRLPALLRDANLAPHVRTHVLGLEAGHPDLRTPLQLADALSMRLADILGVDGLANLRDECAKELDDERRCGTTFTLVQAWARVLV